MNLEEMRRISSRLADPTLTEEELAACYSSLQQINAQMRQDDARRREKPVRFSTGLELSHSKIAYQLQRSSIADFCILHGLTRTEVLERTGLARIGAS